MGGWLLVQQRESGELSFNRSWAEYRGGFGGVDPQGSGELWLGNENLHLLTNQGETMLRVELEDWEGGVASAEYTVRVGPEAEGYALQASGYTGDAGDALAALGGTRFSTYDRDGGNGGGWWYNPEHTANLNGVYRKGAERGAGGVVWATYKPRDYSLKRTRMFIRPATF